MIAILQSDIVNTICKNVALKLSFFISEVQMSRSHSYCETIPHVFIYAQPKFQDARILRSIVEYVPIVSWLSKGELVLVIGVGLRW